MNGADAAGSASEPKAADPHMGVAVTPEDVEGAIRIAIREAANEVVSAADESPGNLSANAEAAASAANVATVWTNIVVGLIAGLERFRLAHDQVKGAATVNALPTSAEKQLLATLKREAANGASPTRIEQLIVESGLFIADEG